MRSAARYDRVHNIVTTEWLFTDKWNRYKESSSI